MSLVTLPYTTYSEGLSQLDEDLWEKLELTSRDPCRTEIVHATNDTRSIVYRAATDESGKNPITTYTDASGGVIATLEWHLRLSDKLSLRGGPKQNVGKWLKNKRGLKGRGTSFTDENGRTYVWENIQGSPDGSLRLFADEDRTDTIAKLIPPAKGKGIRDPNVSPATILYLGRASQLRDKIVLSALLLEKARRFSSTASVFSAPSSVIGLMGMNYAF